MQVQMCPQINVATLRTLRALLDETAITGGEVCIFLRHQSLSWMIRERVRVFHG
jgi:hypothetical protein